MSENVQSCYGAFYVDSAILKKSASGGAAYAFAEQMIDDGGIVYGVDFTDDYKSIKYIKVEKKSDIYKIQGSKYSKASFQLDLKTTVVDDVIKELKTRDVLFVGLPCEVAAIKKASKKCETAYKLITIDLICQGPAIKEVLTRFVEELETEFSSKLMDLSFRYKNNGSSVSKLKATFENGNVFCEELSKTSFWKGFCILKSEACYNCKFKGNNHVSDITIGDYWGISSKDENYNNLGNSILIVHSQEGDSFIAKNKFLSVYPVDFEFAIQKNPMYNESARKSVDHARFLLYFKNKGLSYAAKHGYTLRTKLSNIKRILVELAVKFIHKEDEE